MTFPLKDRTATQIYRLVAVVHMGFYRRVPPVCRTGLIDLFQWYTWDCTGQSPPVLNRTVGQDGHM